MINNKVLTLSTMFYGLAVIVSGLMRYYLQPDGEKGLWFGVVMGGVALFAALLMLCRLQLLGRILASLAVLIVGGWFAYELSGKLNTTGGEPRMYVILALTALQAFILVLPGKAKLAPAKPT